MRDPSKRLKALGNSIVPQQAALVLRAIIEGWNRRKSGSWLGVGRREEAR